MATAYYLPRTLGWMLASVPFDAKHADLNAQAKEQRDPNEYVPCYAVVRRWNKETDDFEKRKTVHFENLESRNLHPKPAKRTNKTG